MAEAAMAGNISHVLLTVSAMWLFSSLVVAAFQETDAGKVLFLEGGQQQFLRGSSFSSDIGDKFTAKDIAASVAVLLGVPPPLMLTSESSEKLDTVLSSNPFRRPRSVIALNLRGIDLDELSSVEREAIFETSNVQQRLSSGIGGQFVLPDNNINVVVLNRNQRDLKLRLKDLCVLLGGALLEEEASGDDSSLEGTVVMNIPVVETVSLKLDLTKEADRNFAEDLLGIYDISEKTSGPQNLRTATLYAATLSSLQHLENKMDATKVLLFTVTKVLKSGEIVGVIVMPPTGSSGHSSQDIVFSVKSPVRARSLVETLDTAPSSDDLSKVNNIVIELETIALVRTSLVVATAIVLLVSLLLGTCYLVGMPLTRDTLLYSGVKID